MDIDKPKIYTDVPEDRVNAVVADVEDLGLVKEAWGTKRKVRIRYFTDSIDDDGDQRMMSRSFNATVKTSKTGQKSSLTKHLEELYGMEMSREALNGFADEPHQIEGTLAVINVIDYKTSDGTVRRIIGSVEPGTVDVPIPSNYTKVRDRKTDTDFDYE